MDNKVLCIILPCYNEEKNIGTLIEAWNNEKEKLKKMNIELQLIVVNDGSSDNTHSIANVYKTIYDNVRVLKHIHNKGLGEALNTGIKFALEQFDTDYICTMDSDMTHDPIYIFSMLDKLLNDDLDCVIASRYRKGSKVEGLSLFRRILSYGARLLYTYALNIPNVRDYTCGYRLYRKSAMEALFYKSKGKIVQEKSFACMMELIAEINKEGFEIGEVSFVLRYQLKGGQSKMKILKTICRSLAILARLQNRGVLIEK